MRGLMVLFVVLETPVLFFHAASVFLLRPDRGPFPLQRLWAFQFPLVALGGVGLPLWALYRLLTA